MFFVFMRHKVKNNFKKNHYSHDFGVILFYKYKEVTSDTIDRYHPHAGSMFKGQLFFELLLVGVTPIPYFDIYIQKKVNGLTFYYFLNDYINAFMALRLFLVVRVFINYSPYTDMYSKKLCEMYGFYTDMSFALKSRLLNYPVKTISTLFVAFVLVYSYLIRIFEAPYYRALDPTDSSYRKFDSLGTSVWLCIITLTTVGYGDVYAVTPEGKVISACIAISGAFLMALVVTIVTSQVELDSKQQLALVHIQLTKKAAVTL
jgi:voltage-gated potassium channel